MPSILLLFPKVILVKITCLYGIIGTKIECLRQNKGQNPIHFHPFAGKGKKWGKKGNEKGKNNILIPPFPLGNQKKRNGKGGMRKKKGSKTSMDST